MTDLVIRRLLIDMEAPIARHWCGNDAFRTALLNAMSMSFPCGEQFFIDTVRASLKEISADAQDSWRDEVQAFIGQEATHRRLHLLFNQHLQTQGLVNQWEPRAQKRIDATREIGPRNALAITAAHEHFTAILAEWILRNPDLIDGGDERLNMFWLWHSAEECEHRSTAFNLYTALGGDHERRLTWFRRSTFFFLRDLFSQTVLNLRHDGTLWKWSTCKSAGSFLFGRRGVFRQTWQPWREYLRRGFHPSQMHSTASQRWLQDNQASWQALAT